MRAITRKSDSDADSRERDLGGLLKHVEREGRDYRYYGRHDAGSDENAHDRIPQMIFWTIDYMHCERRKVARIVASMK